MVGASTFKEIPRVIFLHFCCFSILNVWFYDRKTSFALQLIYLIIEVDLLYTKLECFKGTSTTVNNCITTREILW